MQTSANSRFDRSRFLAVGVAAPSEGPPLPLKGNPSSLSLGQTICCAAGDYGSDCEEEEAPPPKVKQEPLPLPDMFLNQEVKAEPVRQPAATAAHSSAEVAEELDYGSDSEED